MRSQETPKDNFLTAVRHEAPHWIPCPMFDGSVEVVGHGLVERVQDGRDDWGVVWSFRDPKSDSFPTLHPLQSPDEVDRYPMPDADDPTLMGEAEKAVSEIDRLKVLVAGGNGWGLFERAWLLTGMQSLFTWSITRPDAVERLIERIGKVKLRLTQRLIDVLDVDIIYYGDDWGMETRLLFPPVWWRRFIRPWQVKLYKAARKRNILVYQHSDGKVEELIPDLLEIGVDLLNIQRECNDWPKIKELYGDKLTLWGGVSARTLDVGTPRDVAREVEECVQMGRNGGLVLAPGHSLRFPEENLKAMRRIWEEKGQFTPSRGTTPS